MNDQNDAALFELDDEDIDLLPTIDSSHQFLNFSRKVTEAASMRKPVDIQLGIACGKDLFFPSFIKSAQTQNDDTLLSTDSNSSESSLSSSLESYSPKDTTPSSPTLSEATVVKDDDYSDKEDTFFDYELPTFNYPTSTTTSFNFSESNLEEDAKSLLLDKLVADVFNYMDSCPNHSAYSEDLRSLKSKLENYNSSRSSFES